MKRLTLIRHAKSDWTDPSLPDHDRPLAKRGQRDGKWLAATLVVELPEPDLLIASTAQRAVATAAALQQAWPSLDVHPDPRLYLATAKTLLSVLHQLPEEADHVVIVGHHPGLSALADQLAPVLRQWFDWKADEQTGRIAPVLVTAAGVSMTAAVDSWRAFVSTKARADCFLTPDRGVLFSPRHPARAQTLQQAMLTDIDAARQVVELNWEPAPEDVHFLRTRVKRLRAGLRLLQPVLGAALWQQQDDALRALAHCYAPLREHDVNQRLNAARPTLRPIRHRLWQQHVLESMREQAAAQLKQWAAQTRELPTLMLTDRQIAADIARSYRRARRAWRQALVDQNSEGLHRWRLLVKRLMLQLDLAAVRLPVKRVLQPLRSLAETLGEQHDLDLLLQVEINAPAVQRSAWTTAATKLTEKAFALADPLFADKWPRWLLRGFDESKSKM